MVSRLPDEAQSATAPTVRSGDMESAILATATATTAATSPTATVAVATDTPAAVVASPVASPTPVPASPTATNSPEPSPTSTPTATATPAEQPDLSPTIAFPNGQRVLMLYDANSFYLWNPGSGRIPFAALAFEALDPGGQPAGYRFEGSRWTVTGFDALLNNGCAGLKAYEAGERPPSQCVQLNSLRTPTMAQIAADVGFWLSRPNVETFRILWNGEEVARCETEVQTCEVFLPQP